MALAASPPHLHPPSLPTYNQVGRVERCAQVDQEKIGVVCEEGGLERHAGAGEHFAKHDRGLYRCTGIGVWGEGA